MELGLAILSCPASLRGIALSLSPSSPRVLLGEASFSTFSSRNPFQASATRARARLPSLERKHMSILSETRKPVEDEGEEGAVDEREERLSSISSSSFLSLTEKPDRSIALLDDYELEELDSDHSSSTSHRSGYVAVLGKPNVGKSTLSNQMIGQKLSIVTDKPQTTRHRILGICSEIDYQIILYDTPGVIEKKMHKLDSLMMKNVRTAAINADCVLVVVDACKIPKKIDKILEEGVDVLKDKIPILIVLNKKDLIKPGEIAKRLEWYEKFTFADEVIPVSAKYGHGVDDVKDWILSKLPLGPAYYPKDGKALKILATASRLDIEDFLQKKVYLEVEVKVKENWRQDEGLLKNYGYDGQIGVV